MIGSSPNERIGEVRRGDAMRRGVFQLPFARQDAAELGHDILPRQRCADGNVVPRVRARFGILATQNACKDTPVEVDEVIQARLR
jgi:hypothetical protein